MGVVAGTPSKKQWRVQPLVREEGKGSSPLVVAERRQHIVRQQVQV